MYAKSKKLNRIYNVITKHPLASRGASLLNLPKDAASISELQFLDEIKIQLQKYGQVLIQSRKAK